MAPTELLAKGPCRFGLQEILTIACMGILPDLPEFQRLDYETAHLSVIQVPRIPAGFPEFSKRPGSLSCLERGVFLQSRAISGFLLPGIPHLKAHGSSVNWGPVRGCPHNKNPIVWGPGFGEPNKSLRCSKQPNR